MKHRILSWIMVLGFFAPSAASAAEGCMLNQVVGDVRIVRAGETTVAKENDVLNRGDLIRTGPGCQADMSLNDLAGCRVLAGSRVGVINSKPDNMSLAVVEGNVILNLQKLPEGSSFKVETSTAVAAVRGTQFWGRVDMQKKDDPVTTFAVREGEVEITEKATSRIFSLKKGEALDISKDNSVPASVRPALEAEMEAMAQADGIPNKA